MGIFFFFEIVIIRRLSPTPVGCSESHVPHFFFSSSSSSFSFVPLVCHLWREPVIPRAAEMKMDKEQLDFDVHIGCEEIMQWNRWMERF